MIIKIYESIKGFIKANFYFLVFLLCFAIFLNYKLPYVIYAPGGYVTLNDRVNVEDAYDIDGSFSMAYVSMIYGTPATYLLSYIVPNWDIEKIDDITLNGQSLEELEIYQTINMQSSFDLATLNAYSYAGYEIEDFKSILNIVYIDENSITELHVGDVLLEINGIENPSFNNLQEYLNESKLGDKIYITVLRDGSEVITESTLIEINDKNAIGIICIDTYEYVLEQDVTIDMKNGESGPSGGFMMSLAIYNYLVEEDLTNGLNIVGSGTIDKDGNIGQIDGVKYKILGSKDADIFLCSSGNYEEAKNVVEEYNLDIVLYSVNTFEEAVDYLINIK